MIELDRINLLKGKETLIELPINIVEYFINNPENVSVRKRDTHFYITPLEDNFKNFKIQFATRRDSYELSFEKCLHTSWTTKWNTTTGLF